MDDLDQILAEHVAWGREVFTDATCAEYREKVAEESREFSHAASFETVEQAAAEAADVILALALWAERAGVDLARAVAAKAAIVRQRRYYRGPGGAWTRDEDAGRR